MYKLYKIDLSNPYLLGSQIKINSKRLKCERQSLDSDCEDSNPGDCYEDCGDAGDCDCGEGHCGDHAD